MASKQTRKGDKEGKEGKEGKIGGPGERTKEGEVTGAQLTAHSGRRLVVSVAQWIAGSL